VSWAACDDELDCKSLRCATFATRMRPSARTFRGRVAKIFAQHASTLVGSNLAVLLGEREGNFGPASLL
jgi:hypothetical protein